MNNIVSEIMVFITVVMGKIRMCMVACRKFLGRSLYSCSTWLYQTSMSLFTRMEQDKFRRSTAGEATAKAMVGLVVGLTVALIVIGYVLPVGFQGYHAINETLAGFTTQESAMYGVLGIFAMIAILLALISKAVEG